jgi:hypothetical protein
MRSYYVLFTVYYILILLVYTSTFSVPVIFLAHHVHFSLVEMWILLMCSCEKMRKLKYINWVCENFQTVPLLNFLLLLLRFYVYQTRKDIQYLTTSMKIVYIVSS